MYFNIKISVEDITTKDWDPEILKYGVAARHFLFRRDKKIAKLFEDFCFQRQATGPWGFFSDNN